MLRRAERIWPPSGARAERGRWSEAQPNGEGVAAGGATPSNLNLSHIAQSFKSLCNVILTCDCVMEVFFLYSTFSHSFAFSINLLALFIASSVISSHEIISAITWMHSSEERVLTTVFVSSRVCSLETNR